MIIAKPIVGRSAANMAVRIAIRRKGRILMEVGGRHLRMTHRSPQAWLPAFLITVSVCGCASRHNPPAEVPDDVDPTVAGLLVGRSDVRELERKIPSLGGESRPQASRQDGWTYWTTESGDTLFAYWDQSDPSKRIVYEVRLEETPERERPKNQAVPRIPTESLGLFSELELHKPLRDQLPRFRSRVGSEGVWWDDSVTWQIAGRSGSYEATLYQDSKGALVQATVGVKR